jgi:integrase
VRYRNPYQTRHTYASMMLSAGEHPMWVAQQMGHSDWGMIRKVYGRFLPDADPNVGSRAERVYGRAPETPEATGD